MKLTFDLFKESMKFFCIALLGPILVAPAFAQTNFTIPTTANTSGDLSAASRWFWMHDAGTPGSAVGSSEFPVTSPSLDKESREFHMSYSQRGGERFSLDFGNNTEVTHFVYDVYVSINNPSQLANLEMDVNQVMANGQTVIYAFQCSGWSGTWEFSTIVNNGPSWHASTLPCNPRKWSANTWHHIQIASHRDDNGNVTYDWVGLDGNNQALTNATGKGTQDLHWGIGSLNLNFQLDGYEEYSSSVKVYADKLTIYSW
jgi:hypothetical protein